MDFDIWYKGKIIANTTGLDKKQALRNAQREYGDRVAVAPSQGSKEDAEAAKQTSIKLSAQ